MIPPPYVFFLLALGAFRILRLLAWDTFPPIQRARARLLQERVEWAGETAHISYGRPLFADLFQCAFCLGAWVCLAVYLAWWAAPKPTLVVCTVAALSGVVGLIAKNWDS